MSLEMRGLANFIQDLRDVSSNREKEQARIELELGKIRSKFKNTNGLTAYDRKKYVCKLMFIFMLGYPVDFGHMEGVQLLSGTTASEKLIGYLSIAVFLHENHELMTLTTHSIHLDVVSGNEYNTCLALSAIANVGGSDFAEAMYPPVFKLLKTSVSPIVLKKALLTMLRIYRKYPDVVQLEDVAPLVCRHITHTDMGVSLCALSLVQGLLTDDNAHILEGARDGCIEIMSRIILQKQTQADYIYYGVPAPWLQMKAIRLLQQFPVPPNEAQANKIMIVLQKIVAATDKVLKEAQTLQSKPKGTYNRCNAMNSVLMEVVSLTIHYDNDAKLLGDSVDILAGFIGDKKESNSRYMGLVLMTRLGFCSNTNFNFDAHMEQFQSQVIVLLHDSDISIRKKALELLFFMCNASNSEAIIGELLSYLSVAEGSFKEDLVLMVAILAEKYCADYSWYVEIILSMVNTAGAYVSTDIWERVCHVIVNEPSIQKKCSESVFRAVNTPNSEELLVQIAAFVLGEFGYQIALNNDTGPLAQFTVLNSRYPFVSDRTKCLILSTFVKFYNLYDNAAVREKISKALASARSSFSPEVQQRAIEYSTLLQGVSDETLQAVLESMPKFDVDENVLVDRLNQRKKGTDKNVWADRATAQTQSQPSVSKRSHQDPASVDVPEQRAPVAAPQPEAPVAPVPLVQPVEEKAAAPMPPPPGAQKQGNALDDIFGSPTPAPKVDEGAASATASASMLIAMRCNNQGPIVQGPGYSIEAKQEFRGADGRLSLFLKNDGAGLLDNVSVQLGATPPQTIVQFRPAEGSAEPGASIEIQCASRCTGLYTPLPSATIAFRQGGQMKSINVELPLYCHKYIEPYKLDDVEKFSALWNNTPAGDQSLSEQVVHSGKSLDIVEVEAFLFQKLRFYTVRKTATNVLGIGAHASQPSSAVEYTPVLVDAQIVPGGLSVAVRNPSPALQTLVVEAVDAWLTP